MTDRFDAYDTVMAATGWGTLRAGEQLTAAEVADRCGLTAAEVAQALPRLVGDGVLECSDDVISVTATTPERLRELLDLRVLVEVKLARQAADADLIAAEEGTLTRLAADCRRAAERDDELGYIRTDLRFHLYLSGLAADAESVELVRVLRIRNRIGGLHPAEHRRFMDMNVEEHEQIAEAVIAGDPDTADRVLRRHITRIPDSWLQADSGAA